MKSASYTNAASIQCFSYCFGGKIAYVEQDGAASGLSTVKRNIGQPVKLLAETMAEMIFIGLDVMNADPHDLADTGLQRSDGRRRKGTGFKAFRKKGRHGGFKRIDTVSSRKKGGKAFTLLPITIGEQHKAASLQAVKGLVSRCANGIGTALCQGNGNSPCALRGIDDESNSAALAEGADFLDGEGQTA